MINYVISFFIPLVYFLLLTGTLVFLTKRSFGKCLPIGMMVSAFLLFFSQLVFNTFIAGFIVGVLFALSAVAILLIKRRNLADFKKNYFTSGLIVFLLIYVVVFVFDLKREFSVWDELSHWGMMVKEMFRLDNFYSVDASNLLVHKDYPPIIQLFELFWVKLCGGFKEAFVERALHTFELSLLIPFAFEKVLKMEKRWRSVLAGFSTILASVLIVLFFDGHGVIHTIYADYVMAFLVAFLIMTILVNRDITWFEIMSLSVGGSFLLLLKQMGLFLYVIVICVFLIAIWVRKKEKWRTYLKRIGTKKIIMVLVAFMIPLIMWFLWSVVTKDTQKQFSLSELDFNDYWAILLRKGEEWQNVTLVRYLEALGQLNITTSYIQLSFIQIIVLFCVAMCFARRLSKKRIIRKELLLTMVLLVFGAIGYMAIMLMLYVLCFGAVEGPNLASFNRYMDTYAIIMMLIVLMVVTWQLTNLENKQRIAYVLMAVLFVVNSPEAYAKLYPYVYDEVTLYEKYAAVADRLRMNVESDNSGIYIIAQNMGPNRGYHFFTQYYSTPLKINYIERWPTEEFVDADWFYDGYGKPKLEEYDYLFVVDFDENFEKKYCDVLRMCPLKAGNLYKIQKREDGKLRFKYLNNIET